MVRIVQVRNVTRGTTVATAADVADAPWRRLAGLIGRRSLPPGAGLLLPHTPWIHTAFMGFAIDVVLFTHAGHVLRTVEHLPPWRLSPLCWRAYATLELPAGTVQASKTRAGDLLHVLHVSLHVGSAASDVPVMPP